MSRTAFGKHLVEYGTILADIARSHVEMEQAQLLVLKAAHLMDVAGNRADFHTDDAEASMAETHGLAFDSGSHVTSIGAMAASESFHNTHRTDLNFLDQFTVFVSLQSWVKSIVDGVFSPRP
ncbi:acyl-CoA dehydrogenase family member 10 [Sigmodon hispidus]